MKGRLIFEKRSPSQRKKSERQAARTQSGAPGKTFRLLKYCPWRFPQQSRRTVVCVNRFTLHRDIASRVIGTMVASGTLAHL